MPRMFAASRGASSFCTYRPLVYKIPHMETMLQYAFIRLDHRDAVAILLVPERFAGFQGVGNALLGFLFTTEGDERFALEIENILFANHLRGRQRPAGKNVCQFPANVRVIFRSKAAAH